MEHSGEVWSIMESIKPTELQAEIKYRSVTGYVSGDLPIDLDTLHIALNEWYRHKTGYFYVGEPEMIRQDLNADTIEYALTEKGMEYIADIGKRNNS